MMIIIILVILPLRIPAGGQRPHEEAAGGPERAGATGEVS